MVLTMGVSYCVCLCIPILTMQSDDLEWLEAHRLRAPLLLLALDALAAGNREDGEVQACSTKSL
jgi:hypothetical protein